MTSAPTLHKHIVTLNGQKIIVYYIDEQGIDYRGAKCTHTGTGLILDNEDIKEAVRQIEETL